MAVAAVVVATLTAGCSAAKVVRRPEATHSTTPAAVLAVQAAQDECAQFSSTYGAVQADTQSVHTVGGLIVVMGSHGGTWIKSFSRAAQIASRPGVPIGNNRARILAVNLARDALDFSKIRLEVSIGRFDLIKRTWNQAVADLNATQARCP